MGVLGGIKYSFDLEDKEWVGGNNERQGGNGTKSSPIWNSKFKFKKKKRKIFLFLSFNISPENVFLLSDARTLLSKIN